jgi:hypothetical protein
MEKRVRLVEDGTLARETRLGDAFERDANLVQLRALDVVVRPRAQLEAVSSAVGAGL